MAQYHGRGNTVLRGSGRRRKKLKDKELAHWGRDFVPVKIGQWEVIKLRTRGGNRKNAVKRAEFVNVNGEKVKILRVRNNPANRHYARLGIITKGAIVETDKGLVRITSRPGQHGTLNGVFVKEAGA